MKFDDVLMTSVQGDLKANQIPFLLGEPGIGKSSWVYGLAKKMGTKAFTLACNQLGGKEDLDGGRLVPTDDSHTDYMMSYYPHQVISEACRYAEDNPRETPILFMDELNRTTPDVTSACLSIPTMRKIGDRELPKNLLVICAGNDKGNITSLDEASISRFVLYHVEPDVDTYLGLDSELNPFVRQVLTEHPDCIFCKKINRAVGAVDPNADDDDDYDAGIDIDDIIDDAEEMNQISTPRTISGVSNWLNQFNNDELLSMLTDTRKGPDGNDISVLEEALEGHTGATNFTAFLLEAIATGLSTVSNQQNTVNVVEPAKYADMKACGDVGELDTFIDNMTKTEREDCLVYALYEKADNRIYIQQLANVVEEMDDDQIRLLMRLSSDDMLDESNKDVLLATNTPLATTLSVILSI